MDYFCHCELFVSTVPEVLRRLVSQGGGVSRDLKVQVLAREGGQVEADRGWGVDFLGCPRLSSWAGKVCVRGCSL